MNRSIRCNLEETAEGILRVCWGNHERSAPCEWVEFVPRARIAELEGNYPGIGDGDIRRVIAERDRLRGELEQEEERCHRAVCDYLEIHEVDELEGPELDATIRRAMTRK